MKGQRYKGFQGFLSAHWPFLLLLAGLTAFQIWGIAKVPFHPDEATYLYMSGDLEKIFSDPGSLRFDPTKPDDPTQIYRTIDGPLPRYILGLGRWVFGLPALPVDWDWGKTWEQNAAMGALASQELLFAGRLAMTLLLPLSLVLAYALGLEFGGRWSGLFAVFFLGLNALVLLHGRRAMAEGALIFGVLLAFWSFLRGGKSPWLAGLGMAIAFSAKQSAIALFPVGVLAVIWQGLFETGRDSTSQPHPLPKFQKAGTNLVQFLAVFGLLTFALNPVFWRNPIDAIKASLVNRQDLLTRQVEDAQKFAPEQVLETPVKRLAVVLGHLYVLPLQFYEVGNYQEQTAMAEQTYLTIPGHEFLRRYIEGGILLMLTLMGMVKGIFEIRRKGVVRSCPLILLFAATGMIGAALLAAVPLPFQRYPIPLLPFLILWMAVSIGGSGRFEGKKGVTTRPE